MFFSDVEHAILRSTKDYEIGAYVNAKHVVKNFEIDFFKNGKSAFVCCFDHLVDGMRFNTKSCLHYTRRVFFECNTIIVVIKLKSAFNVIE